MSRILDHALSGVERTLLQVIRQVENEEFSSALNNIQEGWNNLLRIRSSISPNCFETLSNSFVNLRQICETRRVADGANTNPVGYIAPRMRTAERGRPKIDITKEQLELLISENCTAQQMAKQFGCSVQLVYKKCYSFGIKLRDKYYDGNEADLRQEVMNVHAEYPNCGAQMMTAYLKVKGIVVQRSKVRSILSEIDPVGTASRWSRAIRRRTYTVPTPNALWHIDAHLKLIRWKFAIHGCIDGYSRLIVYLKCGTAMTVSSVVPLFTAAVEEYGLPSRVRSDFGYENLFVAMVMNAIRGLDRGSHLTGRPVHNQRVERLWVDVFKEVVDFFYNTFYEMERVDELDIEKNEDMFALQTVYLEYINKKLDFSGQAWNSHKVRTAKSKTPRQLWLCGMLENINSGRAGPNDVFTDQGDLDTRLNSALGSIESDYVVVRQEEEIISNLTVQIQISDQQRVNINEILGDTWLDYRSKYLNIRSYLTN